MNLQLIESLVKVILALTEEEQVALSQKLSEAQLVTTHSTQSNHTDTYEQILQPLIAAGRIIPPAHYPDILTISETDFKAMVSNLQISGKPLSETIIEERGEW